VVLIMAACLPEQFIAIDSLPCPAPIHLAKFG
jgi:hypothetical protein